MSKASGGQQNAQRVTVLWFPDWPVYAASRAEGWDVLHPAAVIAEHRVVACNASARKAGVRAGMKQRHALATCPVLHVATDDPAQQAAVHEELLVELESVAAHIETVRAGLLAFPMHALAKFYGDEDTAVELLLNATARANVDCLAGTADDLVTATWAARVGKSVEPGKAGNSFQICRSRRCVLSRLCTVARGDGDTAAVGGGEDAGLCSFAQVGCGGTVWAGCRGVAPDCQWAAQSRGRSAPGGGAHAGGA